MPNPDRKPLPTEVLQILGQGQPGEKDLPRARRVFVNRNLRLRSIDLLGFDMDYTLAEYLQPALDGLSIRLTLDKLVRKRGYPRAILGLEYPPDRAIRGLVVDLPHGNVFKMDAHGHVGRVHHGARALPHEERAALYRVERIRLSAARYACIDSLFALCELVVFLRLVDFLEARGSLEPAKLWLDVRHCIDEAHRDGTLKDRVCSDLPSFIVADPDLPATLHRFRSSGKRLFLLTNSLWPYTDAVMRYLLDGRLSAYPSWRNYFDIVIVGADKPGFFTERSAFVEIDPRTGEQCGTPDGPLNRGRVYHGGNLADFERLAGLGGDRVLYIGDHIYGDILRAKKSSVWRTALIVRELEAEIATTMRCADQLRLRDELEQRRRDLDAELDLAQVALKSLQRLAEDGTTSVGGRPIGRMRRTLGEQIEGLKAGIRQATDTLVRLDDSLDRAYSQDWGPLLKEGNEKSRFGEQVVRYACVYTSRVTNFLGYSPHQYFRAPRDVMPHEL